jgi:predicted double-glycine peptidase
MMLVKQKAMGECAAACLATVIGSTLDEAIAELMKDWPDLHIYRMGVSDEMLIVTMKRLGMPNVRSVTDWDASRPAIVTVPSLNHRGYFHFVVYDGHMYLDPSCEAAVYPRDAPVIDGERTVCWASAIVWGE